MTMMRIKNEEYEEAEGELCDPSTCFFRLEVLVAREHVDRNIRQEDPIDQHPSEAKKTRR